MTTTTVVLSSSPSRSPIAVTPSYKSVTVMSSSPGLPSPSQLFAGMPSQLSGGSRAAPVPKHAVAGFASASTLLRLGRIEKANAKGSDLLQTLGLETNSKVESKAHTVETEVKTAPAFKTPKAQLYEISDTIEDRTAHAEFESKRMDALTNNTSASKKPRQKKLEDGMRQAKVKEAVLQNKEAAPFSGQPPDDKKTLKAAAPKRARTKRSKDENEGQTKIKKTKIVKLSSSKGVERPHKTKARTPETFNTLLRTQEEDARAREEFRDLCLEKAIPIRRGWTPCKDTVTDDAHQDDGTLSAEPMAPGDTPTALEPPSILFSQFLGDFGFAQHLDIAAVRSETSHRESGEVTLKKRKIELVIGAPAPPAAENQKRIKSPKKKPRTITEKATAPFGPADALARPSLLQYFSASEGPVGDHVVGDKSPVNAKTKAPAKRVPKIKVTNPTVKRSKLPILFSPELAMKNAKDQELVFGTSSQLAQEGSPTFMKNLQDALEVSAIVSQESENRIVSAGEFRTSNSLAAVQPRNLWAVASRDANGSLLEAETIDLTVTPQPPRIKPQSAPCPLVPDMTGNQLLQETQPNGESRNEVIPGTLDLDVTPTLQQHIGEPNSAIPKTVAEATLRKRPSNRCPVKNATNSKSDPDQMPNYQGFTDAQLAKEVAAYGFKSIKKRVSMITLLEQCWEARVSVALQEAQANLNPSPLAIVSADAEVTTKSSPAKKRGRPPKSTTASSAIAVDLPPKKPRGRPKKNSTATTPPPKRKRNPISPVRALSEALITAEDDIYDSCPPTPSPPQRSSKSPRQLLLGQPIGTSVNAGTVGNKQDRDRLFIQMTKAITTFPPTNDSKSLTFHERILMYEPVVLEDLTAWLNTQGLASVGEDDEVEPTLVKEWCEERSVCCLWRENLRGGARGRW